MFLELLDPNTIKNIWFIEDLIWMKVELKNAAEFLFLG